MNCRKFKRVNILYWTCCDSNNQNVERRLQRCRRFSYAKNQEGGIPMAVSIKEPVPAKGMPDCPEWILKELQIVSEHPPML